MPRQRKPLSLHKIEGTLRPHRHQARRELDAGADLAALAAPRHLTEAERTIWHEVMAAAPPRLLRQADRVLAELYVRALARYRRAARFLEADWAESGQLPLCGELRLQELALAELGARLGMSPASRAKLATADADPEDAEARALFGPWRVIRGDRA